MYFVQFPLILASIRRMATHFKTENWFLQNSEIVYTSRLLLTYLKEFVNDHFPLFVSQADVVNSILKFSIVLIVHLWR